MTLDDSTQGFRLRVLQEAQRSGNVSATYRRYDVSRTVFYRWRARLALQGLIVAPVTVWRVLRRVGLNHRLVRLAVLEDQSAPTGLLTERTARRHQGRHVVAA
jgi:hypothetical protein